MKAWHFLKDDGTTGYGGLKPQVGEKLVHEGELKLCDSGLHYSLRALDALNHAPGAMACRVEVGGETVTGDDKGVARERTIIAMADATNVLHEFACQCAEDVLHLIPEEGRGVFVAAITAKRAWVKGEISDAELAAARAASGAASTDAAWDAAWDAAGAAAWDAVLAAASGAASTDAQNERLERMLSELLGLNEVSEKEAGNDGYQDV